MRQYQSTDYRYGFNGKETEHDGEFAATVHYDYGFRVYHPAVGRFLSVDPAGIKYPDISSYAYVANNPISFIDPRGDTLRAVNQVSAQRALGLIRSGIRSPMMAAKNIFSLGSDGITFNPISATSLNKALVGLNADEAALVVGYATLINHPKTNIVEVVKRNERVSDYIQGILGYKTGAEVDFEDGGGRFGGANYDEKLVPSDNHKGIYAIIVLNSSDPTDYGTGSWPSIAGEIAAHELVGHGLANLLGATDQQQFDNSIQAGNIYLRTQNKNYYRPSHGEGHSPKFNPQAVPSYLSKFPYLNFR